MSRCSDTATRKTWLRRSSSSTGAAFLRSLKNFLVRDHRLQFLSCFFQSGNSTFTTAFINSLATVVVIDRINIALLVFETQSCDMRRLKNTAALSTNGGLQRAPKASADRYRIHVIDRAAQIL